MICKKIFVTTFLIFVLSGNNVAEEKWQHAPFSGYSNFGSIKMADAKGEMVWIATDSGLATVNLSTMRVTGSFFKNIIGIGHEPSKLIRNLWALDSTTVLVAFRDRSNHDFVRTMYRDSVFIVAPSKSSLFDAVTRTRNGIIVGAGYDSINNKTIYRFYDDTMSCLPAGALNMIKGKITNLIEDVNGTLWITSDSSGDLYRYDSSGVKVYPLETNTSVGKMLYNTNGDVVFVTAGVLITVKNGELKEIAKIDSAINMEWSIIDHKNNFWYWSKSGGYEYLKRVPLGASSEPSPFETIDSSGPIFECNQGIGIVQSKGLKFYPSGNIPSNYISLESQLWNQCGFGGIPLQLLFKKDGSIFIRIDSDSVRIIEYKNKKCTNLPHLPFTTRSNVDWYITESGTLIVPFDKCFYLYNGNSWDSLMVPVQSRITNYLFDDKGRIWIKDVSNILLYENKEWFWIDSSNSNFPFSGNHYFQKFYMRNDGAIVACFLYGEIGSTFDGYHWSFTEPVFEEKDTSFFLYTMQNASKAITGWTLENCKYSSCLRTGRYVYDGTNWINDKEISLPQGTSRNGFQKMYEDKRGYIWLTDYMCCYNGSEWLKYNYSNTHFLGEDPYTGNIYAYEGNSDVCDIYLLEHKFLNLKNTGKLQFKTTTGLMVKNCGKGNVNLVINLDCTKNVAIKLYTLQGKIVGRLYEGPLPKGINERVFHVTTSPGMYVIRMSIKQRADFLQATVRLF